MNSLGIVVPCFNEEAGLQLFYEACCNALQDAEADVSWWFVDDGSTDQTLQVLKELQQKDSRVHYISFSRNFGKESAMLAGLEADQSDYVVTMDADMQDPPALLKDMWDILQQEGDRYDCVGTKRITRKGEPRMRSWFARRFYRLINKLSNTEIEDGARDYRMMKRIVADAVIKDREYNRFSKGIYSWVGFNVKWISYDNVQRSSGKTKWSFMKLSAYALDGIIAFSTVPLMMASVIGMVIFAVSLIALLFIVIRALLFGDPVAGWPSLVSIVLFLGSLELLCIGIMGMYIGKMFLETKHRQNYIVKEKK